MFFRLHQHCFIVKGAKRSALYNTKSGKVLSINQGAVDLLAECQFQPLENVIDMNDNSNDSYIRFLQGLIAKNFGSIWIIEPDSQSIPPSEVFNGKLNFLWLELTNNCNNRCLHCYADSGPGTPNETVSHDRWLSVIDEGKNAGATAIQLIGGEPLLYLQWRKLVERAHKQEYETIEIFTNATLITDEDIQFFKHHKVSIATTIYSDNPDIHDRITLNQGSFTKTLENIKKLLTASIPLRIASIIMKPNETEVDAIMKLCASLGVEVNSPDVIRPTGRGDDENLLPENYTKPPIKPPFYTNRKSFADALNWHPCLAGKLAITATGDVIPCIFARNQICGNILSQSLQDILTGESLQQCWSTTKDKISKCQDCEYRYACSDCRPLAQNCNPDKDWLACPQECIYNPYTGIWG